MVGTITANFYTATNFETLVSANVFQILNVHLGYHGLECFLKRYRFYRLETFGLTKLSMIASYDYWVVLWTIFQSVPRYNLVPSHFTIVLKLSQFAKLNSYEKNQFKFKFEIVAIEKLNP